MKTCKRFTAPLLVAALVILPAAVTQLLSQQGNEAPIGFDTPTLSANPGSQSKGNGLVDDATFGARQAVFEEEDGVDKGLGPIYNARSCAECHQNPVLAAEARSLSSAMATVTATATLSAPASRSIGVKQWSRIGRCSMIEQSVRKPKNGRPAVKTFGPSACL